MIFLQKIAYYSLKIARKLSFVKGAAKQGFAFLHMEIIRNGLYIPLSGQELHRAADEWEHLCRMRRVVKYLANYYDLSLSASQSPETSSPQSELFYNTYKIPFSFLVDSAYNCKPEDILDIPEPAYLFLSNLAQCYEEREKAEGVSEEENFYAIFQEKDAMQLPPEADAQCINLGVFIQKTKDMVIGDPSVPAEEGCLGVIPGVSQGMWSCAVQEVAAKDCPDEHRVSFLIARAPECPYSFDQIVDHAFFWPKLEGGVLTMNGAVGFYDKAYYQDATSFGRPLLGEEGAEYWSHRCINFTLDYPYAGILPHGVVSSSGEGEGCYDVYYLRGNNGKIVAVVADFFIYGAGN